jgi:hypothetical protein
MPAQYAHLDGRRYVNADFVSKVRETYPATTKKIPLGYSTYTGWTGKDEVLFTEHQPLDDLAHLNGQLYEVTFDPSHPECFEQDILGRVSHSTVDKRAAESTPRRRVEATVEQQWGATLDTAMDRKTAAEKRARELQRRRAFVQRILDERNAKKTAEDAPATVDEWIAWDPSAG